MTDQFQLWVYNSENRFVGSFNHNTCSVKRINRFFENTLFCDTLVSMIYVDHSCNIFLVLQTSFPWKRDDQMYLAASAVPPEGNLPAGRPSIGTELRASNIGRWAPLLDKAPRLSIRIVIWILLSDTVFVNSKKISANTETAMLSRSYHPHYR